MRWNRLLVRRLFVSSLLLMVMALPALAEVLLVSANITCEAVSFHATSENSMGNDFGFLTITINDQVYRVVRTSPFEVNTTVPLFFAEAGEYTIRASWQGGEGTVDAKATLVCDATPDGGETPVLDGRICFGPGEVAAAVYRDDTRLDIYSISGDKGQLSIRVDNLFSTAPSATGDVRIARANDVLNIELFRQIDGDFRIVVGPEPVEGKTYECVFSNVCVTTRSWLPNAVPSTPLRCP
jgi:hypothetical protein